MALQQQMIKVALIDDHHMVIEGLGKVIDKLKDIEIIATYTRADALLQGLKKDIPDVLLLDVQLPDMTGLELAKILAKDYPQVRILVLSGVESNYYIQDMIKQGCLGYIFKSTADSHLLQEAIYSVYREELFLDPSVRNELLQEMLLSKRKKKSLEPKLTEREKAVLELIVKEYDNHEIAKKLFISLRTVENHRYHLFQKLEVKSAVGLVKVALQMGLCD